MTIKKSLRFEVFARDLFTCQYCGRRPPDVVLECDHIHPASKGGPNELINLTTSCFDCNRGKRDKVLGEVAPRPDADLMFLKAQQEIAEADRYLEAKQRRDVVVNKLCACLIEQWKTGFKTDYAPPEQQFSAWLLRHSPDEIEYAIKIASPKLLRGQFGKPYSWDASDTAARYVTGILRSRSNEAYQ